jgi:LuxR family maltose regulon positive regulatory protein
VLVYDRTQGTAAMVGSSTWLLTLLDRAPRRLVPASPHYRTIGLNNLGVGHLWAGDLAAARTSLTAARAHARELGMGLAEMSAQAHLAVLQVIHGQLGSAQAEASTAQQVVDRRGWAAEPQSHGLYVALGMTLLARDRLDDAADTITTGLAASSTGSDKSCRLAMGITAIGIAVARGSASMARSAAARLGVELEQVSDRSDLLARWCAVAQAQARLVSGDPVGAIACIRAPTRGTGFAAALERVMLAKAHLALGRPDLLDELLAPLLEPDLPYLVMAVEARVVLAMAADRQHRDSAAIAVMTEAIDLAQPEGIRRPFLDAGPTAAALIGRHRHVTSRHLDFTEHLLPATAPVIRKTSALLIPDRLTERELIVLRYLPTMFKAGEIASDLFVSVNTVKSHLRAIYRKLDVTTRRAAVDRARELNIL